ncbi:MAG: D-aminoacylase [Anaerolineaceae bacterium]|nr:D-aminoacylase [Anaerolineaceae bacterium]
MLDVLIRNGEVIDGTGKARFRADVAVQDGKIVEIGQFDQAQAHEVIEAAGKIVSPGFIDLHSHSELEMLAGRHTAGVQMGVTTEFTGADGFSFAPLSKGKLHEYREYMLGIYGDADVGWDWQSIEDYLSRFNGKIHNNLGTQVPHGVLRLAAKGWKSGDANEDEIHLMKTLTREYMELGAIGVNTGLDYAPTSHSGLEEMIAINQVAAKYEGVFSAHMRGYGEQERDTALDEIIAVGEQAGVPVHISHFFGDERSFEHMETALARGVDLTFDSYCYYAGATSLAFVMPRTMMDVPVAEFIKKLEDPEIREWVNPVLKIWFPEGNPAYVSSVLLEKNKWMEGKTMLDIWAQVGGSLSDFVCDLLIEEKLCVMLVYPWPESPEECETKLKYTLKHPRHMLMTDGIYVGGSPNPRAWGTYPRLLSEYVREKKWLSLEEAVRKMAGHPAERFGLKDRGLLQNGLSADIVVFDPQTVKDMATFEKPRQAPIGIEQVYVNGRAVIRDGLMQNVFPGQVIRRS